MPLKRKVCNLPNANVQQMSFFDPVYQNDDIETSDEESENDLLEDGIPRTTFGKENQHGSNETLDTVTNINSESSDTISTSKIILRIRQIQRSIYQAQTMLESMERLQNKSDSLQSREKLRSIITNLEEQQTSYVNLLNLITLTADERSTTTNRISTSQNPTQIVKDDDLSLRGNIQSPVRPRIESKMGFIPQVLPIVLPTLNLSDNEQAVRNDQSNYDSLVGSLKSDAIYWKDQQATSDDETDAESEKEMEKNMTLQKEQFRALQGQQRALLALKRRSEQGLIEQQELAKKKNTNSHENDLLSGINTLRNRLKILRNQYERKHQLEVQHLKNSSKAPSIVTENRLKNLEHVRERLNELEQIVAYYQTDFDKQQDAENLVQSDDAQRMKTAMPTQQFTNNNPQQLDKLSSDLTTKRLELEQAKSALSQLQQMLTKIQPDEYSSSAHSTPSSSANNNEFEFYANPTSSQQIQTESSVVNTNRTLFSNKLTPRSVPKLLSSANNSVDVKMAAQHREIEHLVESRQRLHTIKDQIASLHQSMTTPPIPSYDDQSKTYHDKLNDSKNIRPSYRSIHEDSSSDDESELPYFAYESEDDDRNHPIPTDQQIQSHIKQSNLCTSDNMISRHEQQSNDLNAQMREICHCLSTFIHEQKSFNRHIEERLTSVTSSPVPQTTDPVFNQLQQQVVTQGLVVNLNVAYREIAVLQSEINALQSANIRLTSSISFDDQYHRRLYSRDDSKESLYSFDQIKPNDRPQPRSKFDEQLKQQNHLLTTETSSKTSFNSQSTGKQTAINVEKIPMKTIPFQHERNATFSTGNSSSSKQTSDISDFRTRYYPVSKENLSKSFVIHRRSIPSDNQAYTYKPKLDQQSSPSSNDHYQQPVSDDDDSDDEQQSIDFSETVFNVRPSSYTTQHLNNDDIQTLDLQIKSIMVQLIPFMRLHINDIFDQSLLNHIRERILFLFKQQPDSAELIRQFQSQFSEIIETTIEKYCGTTIRDCAADLIRDISDVTFDELSRYKIYQNTLQTSTKQRDKYSHLITADDRSYRPKGSALNGEEIGLTEYENRPLTLNGDNDDDSDQEDNDLETNASHHHPEENLRSSESHSNGHEYVLINRSTSDDILREKKNEFIT